MTRYKPDAFIVVMAVDNKSSLDQAERILAYLRMSGALEERTVVLVANKTDLVKSRAIKPLEGKQVAIHYNIKYIETSPGKVYCNDVIIQYSNYTTDIPNTYPEICIKPLSIYAYYHCLTKPCLQSQIFNLVFFLTAAF